MMASKAPCEEAAVVERSPVEEESRSAADGPLVDVDWIWEAE